ncbi:hypothetical protein [Sandaracinus amylolyticus]|uniref:Uncharacterized protein n=1 Tax=Sandaracinus amylolyticus TaxID=927083 RepID=A0A0F6W747_9BACT|nr:hypothetical protein [Sandaracinus amylolyticus]AKF08996.1 hypothetical protein DB32_006145 [Sandaracinus amylolyticus]
MSADDGTRIAPAARLPDGTPSVQWMITDSIHTVASRATPYLESARLFGDRYGMLLALIDAFRDEDGRAPELQRALEVARGLLAQGKRHLHDAWDARTGPAVDRRLDEIFREATPPRGTVAARRSEAPIDPFATVAAVIQKIDRAPDRAEAATEFAVTWALLRRTPVRLRELREQAGADDRELLDAGIRSAGRWMLDLEEAWSARTFDELLGRPTLGELLQLVFPPPSE